MNYGIVNRDGTVERLPGMPTEQQFRWIAKHQKRVAASEFGWCWVSTVFLGLDHGGWRGEGSLWFETMIFVDGWSEIYMERYATLQEARRGHARACRYVTGPLRVRRMFGQPVRS